MNKIIKTFMMLLLISSAASAQFVEIYRSEAGQRPAGFITFGTETGPFKNGEILTNDEFVIEDYNGNGSVDFIRVFNDTIMVIDGLTQNNVYIQEIPSGATVISVIGLSVVDHKSDDIMATHTLTQFDGNALMIINTETGESDFGMQNASALALDDFDNNGSPDIAIYDIENQQVFVISWGGNGNAPNRSDFSAARTELSKSNQAYELALKYESEPNERLAVDRGLFAHTRDLDVNGDGTMEIVTLVDDNNGNAVGMRVFNGVNSSRSWDYPFPAEGDELDDIRSAFYGFFDVNGDGQKEAIFGSRSIVTLDKTLHSLDANFEILAIYDLDGDSYPELIGRDIEAKTVQVWGSAANPTGVSSDDLTVAGFRLHQNYPNPFNPNTNIAYSLEKAGQVELHIYDILGRQIRQLVSAYKTAGQYTVSWNGQNDSGLQVTSGSYFYKLKVDGSQLTGRMVLMK